MIKYVSALDGDGARQLTQFSEAEAFCVFLLAMSSLARLVCGKCMCIEENEHKEYKARKKFFLERGWFSRGGFLLNFLKKILCLDAVYWLLVTALLTKCSRTYKKRARLASERSKKLHKKTFCCWPSWTIY